MTVAAIDVDARPRAVATASCPVCKRTTNTVLRTRAEIAAELNARDTFFAARLDRGLSRRDLTDVVLGTPAAILRCPRDGVLMRDAVPGDEIFRDDRYDDSVLEALHETHARAFAAKENDYRSLLPSGARVIEVGSYAGGFLATAARWGWRASGADIGRDPVRFSRALGLDVRCLRFEECGLDAQSLDAVFVWNCFEQVARSDALLAEAHRVLCDGGSLVLRVPDADFYMRESRLAVLASNGLLGWPHRFGYGTESLRELVQRHGFTFMRVLRRPAIRPSCDAMRGDADQGWIEVTFRS